MSKKQKEHTDAYVQRDLESNMDTNHSNIFNNPTFKAAFNSLSEEDKEKYKKIGEDLYNTIDFTSSNPTTSNKEDPTEMIAYIENQLRSGIHPSDMEEGEKLIMSDIYGEEWYTKWGYVKGDLDDIITVKT